MPDKKINQMVDDHANSLYFFAIARVNDPVVAEDLVQELSVQGSLFLAKVALRFQIRPVEYYVKCLLLI